MNMKTLRDYMITCATNTGSGYSVFSHIFRAGTRMTQFNLSAHKDQLEQSAYRNQPDQPDHS